LGGVVIYKLPDTGRGEYTEKGEKSLLEGLGRTLQKKSGRPMGGWIGGKGAMPKEWGSHKEQEQPEILRENRGEFHGRISGDHRSAFLSMQGGRAVMGPSKPSPRGQPIKGDQSISV